AYVVPHQGGVRVVATEGGHATLAAADDRQAAVLALLRRRFGHVSAERVLSGPGLESLYQAICELDGYAAGQRAAAQIPAAAVDQGAVRARAALTLFCDFLGGFAGNLALAIGARGGVTIAGGIAPKIIDFLAASGFRERFEAKGRLSGYLQ